MITVTVSMNVPKKIVNLEELCYLMRAFIDKKGNVTIIHHAASIVPKDCAFTEETEICNVCTFPSGKWHTLVTQSV